MAPLAESHRIVRRVLRPLLPHLLPHLRRPVLSLHGDQDVTAPLKGMRLLAGLHRRSTVPVLEGGDHHLLVRHRNWVRDAIRALAVSTGEAAASGAGPPPAAYWRR